METRKHFKNGAALKSLTSKIFILLYYDKIKEAHHCSIPCFFAIRIFFSNFWRKDRLEFVKNVLKDDEGTYNDDMKMNPGFHLGTTAEFPISEILSFETGLLLTTKGLRNIYEETLSGETIRDELKTTLFYLDIPLTAKSSFDLHGVRIYGVFGPYIGIGLSGKTKAETKIMGVTEKFESNIKWGSDELQDDLRRIDYGLIVGSGVEINAIQISLSYGLGLANISLYRDEGARISNRVLGISVGYKINEK